MTFVVTFEDEFLGTLTQTELRYFVFYSSMTSLYSSAKVILKEIDSSKINKIKVGTPVNVVFYEEENTEVTYTNKMKVLTFSKEESSGAETSITLVLVSELFFNSDDITCAYEGSVSQILNTMVTNNLKETITNYDFEVTEDRSRTRYRISEEPQEFIKRIMKYGIIGNGPIYVYYDAKGCFNLKGINSLRKKDPAYIDITPLVDKSGIEIESSDSTQKLIMYSHKFNINKGKQTSKVTSVFNTELFKSPNDVASRVVVAGEQDSNASVETVYPHRVDYYDWNVTPDDALSIALRTSFEDLGLFQTLQASYNGFKINELDLGSIHYVILPYEPTEKSSTNSDVNSSEGTYMVMNVSFIYEDGIQRTEANLIQVGH